MGTNRPDGTVDASVLLDGLSDEDRRRVEEQVAQVKPDIMFVKELREALGLSQAEMIMLIAEGGGTFTVTKLLRVVREKGGTLTLRVEIDGVVKEISG